MSYIDPEGMYGGDRIAMLSDPAKLAWPWFWCASNTVGRIELNYRVFCNTVFRQFRKPPTEASFWEWVSEYHESFLMFVYKREGKVWGQWDVSEKYLPKYKTKSDEKTPAPNAREWIEWKKLYEQARESKLSGKCRVLNISGNFRENTGFPTNSPVSVVVGVGVGVVVGKNLSSAETADEVRTDSVHEHLYQDRLMPEAPPAQVYGKAWFDAQHDNWYRKAYWRRCNKSASRRAYEKRIRMLVADKHMSHENAAAFLFNQAVLDRKRSESTGDWNWRQNLQPATWLNGSRWEDEANKDPPRQSKNMEINYADLPGKPIWERESES